MSLFNPLVDWDFNKRRIELNSVGGNYDRPPFNPTHLIKLCLFAFIYNLSDHQITVCVIQNLLAKDFIGLGLDTKYTRPFKIDFLIKQAHKTKMAQVF